MELGESLNYTEGPQEKGKNGADEKIPLVVVAGPTASGKTALGVHLCQCFNGEVVSADSMQIYRYLDIGTAKPSEEEKSGIPHHLMDFLPPDQPFSVADYVEQARKVIAGIRSRGKLPVVVGGTGLYISSLVDNIQFSESEADPAVRRELEQFAVENGSEALWEKLNEIDPKTAQSLHPNNRGRVIRALEIFRVTGIPMSRHQEESRREPSPYRACMIGLNCRDRQKLYDRINLRVDQMLEQGLVEEAERLMEQGWFDKKNTSLQAIGYKEMESYLKREETLEQAAERIRQETRRYAKRQLTWFRRDQRYQWFYLDDYSGQDELKGQVCKTVSAFLTAGI